VTLKCFIYLDFNISFLFFKKGGPNALAKFNGTILTDPVFVPGVMDIAMTLVQTVDSPDDLVVRKTTVRLDDNYTVPCFDVVSGTWY
jgi:hypothetical protein